jgi:transcriptional regulator with XRE-family HTH domain
MARRRDLQEIVGKNIRRIREELGLSQLDLAKRCKMTNRYVSILETRPRNLTLATIQTIADALGVHPCDLICSDRPTKVGRKEAVDLAIQSLQKYRDTL